MWTEKERGTNRKTVEQTSSSLLFVAGMSVIIQSNVGSKKVISAYRFQVIRLSRQTFGGRNKSRDQGTVMLTGLHPLAGSATFLI